MLLVAILIGHLHAAGVGGDADVVGDEDEERVRIGIFTILFDGAEFWIRSSRGRIAS